MRNAAGQEGVKRIGLIDFQGHFWYWHNKQLELDMEKQTGSKLGKEYVKAVICYPVYLTYMQSTSWEMLGWMNHKLVSMLLGGISTTSDTQMIPL